MPSVGISPEVHLVGVLSQLQTSPCSGGHAYPTASPSVLSSTENKPELLLLQATQSSLTGVELQPWSEVEKNTVYLLNSLIN